MKNFPTLDWAAGKQAVEAIAPVISTRYWDRLGEAFTLLFLGQAAAAVLIALLWGLLISQFPKLINALVSIYTPKDNEGNDVFPILREGFTFPNLSKLVACILIDSIGASNELLPWFGEIVDVVWAPIAAIAVRRLFWGSNVVFFLEFVEEILPFTDFIPLATICWCVETFFSTSDAAKLLGIGDYRMRNMTNQRVDLSKLDIYADEFYVEKNQDKPSAN